MYGSGIDSYGNKGTQGTQDNRNLPQNTGPAARQALEPQQGEDIFKPQTPPDVEILIKRLNELEDICAELCKKLYGPPPMMGKEYKQPPYLERERTRHELNQAEEEKWSIQAQLREILDSLNTERDEAGAPFSGSEERVVS